MELPAGADEQAGTNLRVQQTLSGQPGGVRAGWAVRLRAVSPVVARLGDTALAAQPPAVEQARTGQFGTKPGPAKVEPVTAGSA
jgi:hypothetical protein